MSAGRACLFCGGRPVTNEHAWPRWIGRELGALTSEPFTVTRHSPDDETESITWYPPEINFQARQFCGPCNSGWMSQIEADVQPVMRPMMHGQETVLLSPAHARRLARWVWKTALVVDLVVAGERSVPPHFYPDFFKRRWPPNPGAVTWTTAYGGPRRAAFGRGRRFRVEGEHWGPGAGPKGHSRTTTHGFAITFSVFRVVFQALAYYGGDWRPTRDGSAETERLVLRLWPPERSAMMWPKNRYGLGTDGLDRFAMRLDFVDEDSVFVEGDHPTLRSRPR